MWGFSCIMKDFAEKFYKSKAWQSARASYAKSVGGLCEVCLKKGLIVPGVIVHHKVHVTEETIHDPEVLFSPENMMLVCRQCHSDLHAKRVKRYKVDELGRVITRED